MYAHGVNLGALDFQGILEEMRLDGLEELEDEQRVRELISQRQNYLKTESTQVRILIKFLSPPIEPPIS